MWNHKSANVVVGGGGGDGGDVELNSESGFVGVVDEKLEKHVDLSNYLSYLQSLFNKPTSDSEGSDSEINNVDEVQNVIVGFGGNSALLASNVTQQDKFLSSTTQEGINSIGKSGGNYGSSTFEASTTSSSSSSSSSPCSQDEDSSFLPNDLTPMSDMELNNLLRKTNYLGPDADPISFELEDTSTTDSDNKKNTKKKKKKSKKKNDDGLNHRHNKPNSDGKGNGSGHSGYRGDSSGPGMNNTGNSNNTDSSSPNKHSGGSNSSRLCNSRTRKQSLKFLRAQISNNSNSSSQSSEYSFNNPRDLKSDDGTNDEQSLLISRDLIGGLGKKNGKSALNKKFVGTPLSQAIHNSVAISCATSSKDIGLPGTPERLSRDDDDNNSLSDYISMAATAAATTAQVPPLPLHLGDIDDDEDEEDEDFDFDEKVFNSICMKLTSSTTTEDSIQELNSSPQSSNPRKRKFDVIKEGQSSDEPESKKQMVQKSDKLIELLNLKRRKIYLYICKKEIPKSQRTMMCFHKEAISAKRKLAQSCARFLRQKAIQSQKIMKESVWRAKRLTREMQTFWKQAERAEKELRRRREKQAEEQRKQDEEILESKRHLKNLNCVITQAELYAQTVSKKLCRTSLTPSEELDILMHLNENEPEGDSDQSEWEALKKLLKLNVERAIKSQGTTVKQYLPEVGSAHEGSHELTLKLYKSDLKLYQIKGVQWLINLYNQGINGILADDNELGKVSQAIAFLCHLAERRGTWGPFLIVSPSSQIQNWHQEFARVVPDFKVILYTGNPQERKASRSSWNSTNTFGKKDAAFHVVISTCQIVSADLKYVDKINWRYLILDEAHSTKSPSCSRWKALLSFSCRNRLLISKPPVVSGIGEIWSLLHFLAPSLYDTNDEFNEWFSKDIESVVENKKLLNERGLSRLQTSLIPFVLRRTKRDVDSGLTIVKCPLSFRQKSLYRAIKLQIKKEESSVKHSPVSNGIHNSTMMNLVAQLRKICNHPDLVEERHACSSLHLPKVYHYYPKFIYNRKCSNKTFRKRLLDSEFNIFNPVNIHRSLFCDVKPAQAHRNRRLYNACDISVHPVELPNGSQVYEAGSEWSFLRLINISCGELWDTLFGTPLHRLKLLVLLADKFVQKSLKHSTSQPNISVFRTKFCDQEIPRELVFVHPNENFYTWGVEKLFALSNLASKHTLAEIRPMQRIMFPELLRQICPRVVSEGSEPFFIDTRARNKKRELKLCDNMFQPNNGYEETDPIYEYFRKICPYRFSSVTFPERESFINDSGKFVVLKKLLSQLLAGTGAAEGNKIVICSRTCKMIDVLQEFLRRLKIAFTRIEDCDLVNHKTRDLEMPTCIVLIQTHLFLKEFNLSTYNTVIFYDSDSSLSADQQMIDRVLTQGHTQQFVLYRLVCKGTIEDLMLVKGEGGRGKQESLKIRDIVSLIHDDDDLKKYHQKEPETQSVKASSSKGTSSQAIQSSPEPVDTIQVNVSWNERKRNHDPQVATSLISNVQLESSYGESMEGSLPPSPNLSDEIETDFPDVDFSESTFEESVGTPSSSSYFDEYGRPIDWNVSVSDYEEDMTYISKKPRIGRGTGKRGRPPSRVRVQMREVDSGQIPVKRGPGRPRLRPIGPPNQGVRGRRPGRPPLSKKAETVSSSLTPLTPSQRVFGIYSSPDINMS